MLKRIATLSAVTVLLVACNQEGKKDEAATESKAADQSVATQYKTNEQIVSYGVGFNIGSQVFRDPSFKADEDAVIAGLKDAAASKESQIPQDKLEAAVAELQKQAQAKKAELADQAKKESDKYIKDLEAKGDFKKTDSGLLYQVIKSGDGDQPGADDVVKVNYHGTLTDGTVFDSSVDRGKPVEFPVSGVIPGWTEALQMMHVGDKWKLVIPPELAYGENPPPSIPVNAVLTFDVELLAVKKQEDQK